MIIICLHNYLTFLGFYKHQKFKNFIFKKKKTYNSYNSHQCLIKYIVPIFFMILKPVQVYQIKIPLLDKKTKKK